MGFAFVGFMVVGIHRVDNGGTGIGGVCNDISSATTGNVGSPGGVVCDKDEPACCFTGSEGACVLSRSLALSSANRSSANSASGVDFPPESLSSVCCLAQEEEEEPVHADAPSSAERIPSSNPWVRFQSRGVSTFPDETIRPHSAAVLK